MWHGGTTDGIGLDWTCDVELAGLIPRHSAVSNRRQVVDTQTSVYQAV